MAKKQKSTKNKRKAGTKGRNGHNGRKNTKKIPSRSSKYAVLEVKLSLTANTVLAKDKKSVELAGLASFKNGPSKSGNHGIRDQELAARQLSKGAKLDRMSELLEAMGHSQRIRILIKLLGGDATHKLLSKETHLKAGPLYHHIRELRTAGLIGPKVRDLYTLSRKGRRAVMVALAMGQVCK